MKRLSRRVQAAVGAASVALAFLSSAVPGWAAPAAPPASASPGGPGGADARARGGDRDEGPPLLFGGRKPKVGAYASLGGAYTRLMGRDSGLVSMEGALLIDHRLSLGVVGYGFTRTPSGPLASDGDKQQFGAGYGGLSLRYSVFGGLPLYGTFGLVLGAGAVNLHRDSGWDDETSWDDGFRHDERWDAGRFDMFLFAQPEVALNTNVTRWLRLGASLGYRFTGGVSRFGLGESDVNGVVAGANVAFGWF